LFWEEKQPMTDRQNRCAKAGLAIVLSLLLTLPATAPLRAAPPQEPSRLKILVLEGEGAINNIRQRTARDPIIEVQDENNKPVAGAVVTFLLPDRGASGTFANGARSVTVATDAQGRATATGLQPNNVTGNFQIQPEQAPPPERASSSPFWRSWEARWPAEPSLRRSRTTITDLRRLRVLPMSAPATRP
jgi:hypothetical protein